MYLKLLLVIMRFFILNYFRLLYFKIFLAITSYSTLGYSKLFYFRIFYVILNILNDFILKYTLVYGWIT